MMQSIKARSVPAVLPVLESTCCQQGFPSAQLASGFSLSTGFEDFTASSLLVLPPSHLHQMPEVTQNPSSSWGCSVHNAQGSCGGTKVT